LFDGLRKREIQRQAREALGEDLGNNALHYPLHKVRRFE
jgi:hypothetical protein